MFQKVYINIQDCIGNFFIFQINFSLRYKYKSYTMLEIKLSQIGKIDRYMQKKRLDK